MISCANCSYQNTDDARFCENCGRALERSCPNCGRTIAAAARFCKYCGQDLAAPVSARLNDPPVGAAATHSEPLQALRRAAPEAVASKILASCQDVEGERKLVTTLFTDIVSSTSLAEGMDPEDWRDVVTGAHRLVSAAAYRYEGTIAQLLGDGVLAFFGAPLAHEDDAERAVRADLQIMASISAYAERLRRAGRATEFHLRAGLNSGPVVVGNIGNDLHMEYLAIGDTVNLASRIQSAAEPDTVLVSEATHRLVTSLFEFDDRGLLPVKGKAEPVHAYRVTGERRGATRLRGIAGLSSPLVGRRRELGVLQQVVFELQNGHGAVVTVLGEAGLGKSRLIAEWRAATQHDARFANLRWAEGRCVSYGTTMGHHLTISVLRALVNSPADATIDEAGAALRQTVQALLGEECDQVFPFLGHLLGLDLDAGSLERVKYLDGPTLQLHYVAAFKRLLAAQAQVAPLVVVCEDLHWADPSSVELLGQVLPGAGRAPIAFVLLARPDRDAPGWQLLVQVRDAVDAGSIALHLPPLSTADSRELVDNLLQAETLPETLRAPLLAKAEGNPFFVEEVLRMLIDRGALVRDASSGWQAVGDERAFEIPDTLQGVLAARIDRLPEDAKRLLQVASVIGRQFPVRLLLEVLSQEPAL